MTKLSTLNKKYGKNASFKSLYQNHQSLSKAYKTASGAKSKAKAKYLTLKKKKGADKSKLQHAACACKVADNDKRMYRKLTQVALQYLEKWVSIEERCVKQLSKLEKAKKDKASAKKAGASKTKKEKKKSVKKEESKVVKTPLKGKVLNKKVKKSVASTKRNLPTINPPIRKTPKKIHTEVVIAKTVVPKTTAVKAKPTAKKTSTNVNTKPNVQQTPKPRVSRRRTASTAKKDNLKRIEGIGPKIEGLMHAAGIHTFNQVGRSSVARLQGILTKAGSRFSFADPATWPQQAKLANAGKWEELKTLQGELKGGKKV